MLLNKLSKLLSFHGYSFSMALFKKHHFWCTLDWGPSKTQPHRCTADCHHRHQKRRGKRRLDNEIPLEGVLKNVVLYYTCQVSSFDSGRASLPQEMKVWKTFTKQNVQCSNNFKTTLSMRNRWTHSL